MLIVGLTGGIGSGKSTVAALLAGHGAHVIDVDAVGRQVIAPGGRAEADVLAEFGPSIAAAGLDGDRRHIDRAALARSVFGKPDELFRLTAISHPAINAELADRIDALPTTGIVVLDMAILVESNLGRLPDGRSYSMVVVVEAPVDLRVQRAVERGMRDEDVRARIASQATDDDRRAVADVVIVNDGGLDALATAVAELWSRLNAWL
jgi:dephospho-CoA kinase